MAFCGDQEDVVSISLTAVKRLLEKYDIDPRDIGRRARVGLLRVRVRAQGQGVHRASLR